MTTLLALLIMGAGVLVVFSAVSRRGKPSPPQMAATLRAVTVGVLLGLVGFVLLGLGFASTEEGQSPAVQSAPAPEAVVPAPSGRSDLQNLAVVAGVSENDAELNAQYTRLVTLCPPETASVGDMAVSLQRIVREESGRDMALVDVMRQLATAQEGGQAAGMKCSETGGMLAELLIKGM